MHLLPVHSLGSSNLFDIFLNACMHVCMDVFTAVLPFGSNLFDIFLNACMYECMCLLLYYYLQPKNRLHHRLLVLEGLGMKRTQPKHWNGGTECRANERDKPL